MLKRKKAQLTIFIIIAIFIVAVVALFFVLRGNLNLPGKPASPETAEIQNFVQGCLDDSLEKVVFRIGENGGYYSLSKSSTPLLEVPYYIKNNQNLMPSKEKIQGEISKGIAKELTFCLEDPAFFPEYEITKGKMASPEIIIEPERVLVEVNYPLTIKKEESRSKIEDFNSEVPIRLGIIYDAVSEFIDEDLKEEGICLDCFLIAFTPSNLKSNVFWEIDGTAIFIVRDFESIIDEKEFVFNFANEYKS